MSNSNIVGDRSAGPARVLGLCRDRPCFRLPVFLQPIARDTGWSVTGVSSAMTIVFLAMACTSMLWGTYVRPVRAAAGGADRVDRAAGKPGAGQPGRRRCWRFKSVRADGRRLDFRDLCAMMACVTGWFDNHRSLASRWCRRHGDGAADHVAARRLVGLEP